MILEAKYQSFDNFQFDYDTSSTGQVIDLLNRDIFWFPKENYYTSEENYLRNMK